MRANRTTLRTAIATGVLAAAIALTGCAGGNLNSSNLNLPPTSGGSCAEVAVAAQTEFNTWDAWRVAMDEADQAASDYMDHKVDYRVQADADAKQAALGTQYVHDGIRVINENIRAGRNCPDLMTAHDALKKAEDLLWMGAAGAEKDVADAEAAWTAAYQAATS